MQPHLNRTAIIHFSPALYPNGIPTFIAVQRGRMGAFRMHYGITPASHKRIMALRNDRALGFEPVSENNRVRVGGRLLKVNCAAAPATPPTKVMFRCYVDKGVRPQEVTALFPEIADTPYRPDLCSCYESRGGHASARIDDIIAISRPATPEEYADLKRELERYPYYYRLDVKQRTPAGAYQKRKDMLEDWINPSTKDSSR